MEPEYAKPELPAAQPSADERRRSARHLLNHPCEVHIGPITVTATVRDVSQHGMGLSLPPGTQVQLGEMVWVVVSDIANYAITATIARISGGTIGLQFVEILAGEALERVESLPLTDI